MFSEAGGKTISRINGSIRTPFFMPDATRASIRGMSSLDAWNVGTRALVVNTYHLLLRPGSERIARLGGIHRFMRWDGLVLSDSGGYQVYSLIHKNKNFGRITDDGAEFRSVFDGKKYFLTPETSIAAQFDIGSDMMVVLDDPRPNSAPEEEIEEAVFRTLKWAKRCREEYERQIRKRDLTEETRPLLFGVVQGGNVLELRKRCVEGLVEIGFDGYGFGARHIGENGEFLKDIVRYTADILPRDAIRFALGVGKPEDIVRCFSYGWEMFDCVVPTREGRHGRIFVFNDLKEVIASFLLNEKKNWYTTLDITNEKFSEENIVVQQGCECPACLGGYSRAYLHHLFRSKELLGGRLAAMHNLFFYNTLMDVLKTCSKSCSKY